MARRRYAIKLNKQERELIELLRRNEQDPMPDWAVVIECRNGAWDVYVRGMIGGARGVGTSFTTAWRAYRRAPPEDMAFPPP